MTLKTTKPQEWARDGFMISTDPSLIDLAAINTAFAMDALPWAKPLPDEELKVMLDHSVCFGLYSATAQAGDKSTSHDNPKPAMIGLARLVTDCTTVAYLTDVYVLPEWQNNGLGSWLIEAVKEWWDMVPNGRRLILVASEGAKEEYYAKKLLTGRMEDEGHSHRLFTAKGRGTTL